MQWLYKFCTALYCPGDGAYGLPQRVARVGDLCLLKVVKIAQSPLVSNVTGPTSNQMDCS